LGAQGGAAGIPGAGPGGAAGAGVGLGAAPISGGGAAGAGVALNLLVTSGTGESRRVSLNVRDKIVVGRSGSCDFIFEDQGLSRRHFSVEIDEGDGQFYITNLSGTNGTYVNGVQISGRRKLSANDVILAGQEKFVYLAG
jgi:pSer/pThr/pTyr-binding forkhead associated (FHA) protein